MQTGNSSGEAFLDDLDLPLNPELDLVVLVSSPFFLSFSNVSVSPFTVVDDLPLEPLGPLEAEAEALIFPSPATSLVASALSSSTFT